MALRVLQIEDSADDAELIVHRLREAGLAVDTRRVDSAEGLSAALALQAWDIVLCDYALPSFDALAALAILRREHVDLPFIIVSGTMLEEAAVRAMKAGACDFFKKDNLTRLPAAIEREMREAEIRREREKLRAQLLLSDRLISIGTLAAGVAHEINNPLAYVVGNIEFAIERLSGAAGQGLRPAECAELLASLQQAREGSERIRVTTRDLRVFCRTEDTAPAPVDVTRVMESAISMAWNELRHRAHVVRNFQPVPSVLANESRLGQVFLNLLINAAQAIEDGDPTRHEVRVSAMFVERGVQVEISDTGKGMGPEVLAQLFQPFFTTKPIGVGTGLGLSICRGIIEELGGEIAVESQLHRGTTVRVSLPASQSMPAPRKSNPVPPSPQRARVLVIDDEPALCQIVNRVLSSEHEVIIAQNARSALQLLATDPGIDVVLCDLMMPEMSGMDFHAKLMETAPEIAERVVFLTGGAFSSRAAQFLDRVKNTRLDKPFDPAMLRKAVAKAIAKHEQSLS
ncbi:MAG TPA: response regulator [Polyangiales bacterium]|nr:response regulator [Polyangiales bacterium]